MKDKDVPQLSDPTFLSDLAFLTDITQHLNTLNLQLQGPKQAITLMYDCIKNFKCKLSLWAKQLAAGNLAHLLLQCDTVLKQKYKDVGVPEFYTFLSRERYPKIVSAAAEIMTMFGST